MTKTTDPRDKRMDDLTMENHRLRMALSDIVSRYPCSTIRDMRRVAAEALGVPAPEFNND